MSTDLQQFHEIFFEEASELLAEMEMCLLGLDVNVPNVEDLNAIFRAAHSIKGGASAFGFKEMAEMTHMLESLLDKLRKGDIEIRNEMIDSFLKAGDVIKRQLAAHRGNDEADTAMAKMVHEELKKFNDETLASTETIPASTPKPTGTAEIISVAAKANEASISTDSKVFNIQFSKEGLNPKTIDNLLSNLGNLGTLERLALPDKEQLCELQLTTNSNEEDIWEVLAFIVNPENLMIKAEASIIKTTNTMPVTTLIDAETEKPCIDSTRQEQIYNSFSASPTVLAASKAVNRCDTEAIKAASAQSPKQQISSAQNNPPPNKKLPKTTAVFNEANSIRVSIEKVDQMINLVGELVITQAMLSQTVSEIEPVVFEKLLVGMKQLERNTRDLQERVMSIRMLPVSSVFSRFPRVIREISTKLNKQVELKIVGEGTELDKGLIEKIIDPLTHLVRNSLDHGIELPEKRIAVGKPAKGTIILRAFHQGGSMVIEVTDDGAGLNRENILEKAMERGLSVYDAMTDQEVWMLIFEAGISTAEEVTDVSGRGVGMDVVKRNVQSMGGRIEIDSTFGVGTRTIIRLPLTLAILDGLSVAVGDQIFIVPLTYIAESFQSVAADIKTIRGQGRMVQVRGVYLPVIALHEIFHIRPKSTEIEDGILVILDAEGQRAAMFVDALVGQHQVVIKSLEDNFRRVQGVSGATILGDGRVALILDAANLIMASQQVSGRIT